MEIGKNTCRKLKKLCDENKESLKVILLFKTQNDFVVQ